MRQAMALAVWCCVAGGCGGEIGTGGRAAQDGGLHDGHGIFGDGAAPDAPMVLDGGGPGSACSRSEDCTEGVCVAGSCCPSLAQVCGDSCCALSAVCLFQQCVVPGKPCHTGNDCAPGQYCETALGSNAMGDGGSSEFPALDSGCQSLPTGGACVDRPPVCAADAGPGEADAGCLAACEYHPPPTGPLNAVPKWTWGPVAKEYPDSTDVWATPTVGRLHDSNCDGVIDELDPPAVVFVSGNAMGNCCQCTGDTPTACHKGVLRMLDGATGNELWSLASAGGGSLGFAGLSSALGDIDGDGRMDIIAATGEGLVVLVSGDGKVLRTSDKPIPGNNDNSFGWGGGLAVADMDGDGFPEIAYGATVFSTTGGAITRRFVGAGGTGGSSANSTQLSTFVDLDGAPDNHLELLAGNTAYKLDGTMLWNRADLADGYSAVGDFDRDGKPEAVLVAGGMVYLLDGATGKTVLGPVAASGTGGPPTVADFDGDGKPEIGIAQAKLYSVLKPNYAMSRIDQLWQTPNHDFSSSVTGSTVFDFEGDGQAEVIYGDECYLWVFAGATGAVRFSAFHTSFTGTEASLVADVDGDGRAEILMVSNGADPAQWKCIQNGAPTVINGVTWQPGPTANQGYRGIVVFGDKASSWVGTRSLWNEHTYHVTNICDDRDSACAAPNKYGSIPKQEKRNIDVSWLNDFRQNVQDHGLFDAPDATVSLTVDCTDPIVLHPSVRNIGLASLVAGVEVDVFQRAGSVDTLLGKASTTHPLSPGQTEVLTVTLAKDQADPSDTFVAKIINDPANPTFHECRNDNDDSLPAIAICLQ